MRREAEDQGKAKFMKTLLLLRKLLKTDIERPRNTHTPLRQRERRRGRPTWLCMRWLCGRAARPPHHARTTTSQAGREAGEAGGIGSMLQAQAAIAKAKHKENKKEFKSEEERAKACKAAKWVLIYLPDISQIAEKSPTKKNPVCG